MKTALLCLFLSVLLLQVVLVDSKISYQQFANAVTSSGYQKPSGDKYNAFINNYEKAGGITSNRELAMFLSEILWESGGLIYKEEIRCKQSKCPGDYRSPGDDPHKFYYGRGYIQLTWSYNYRDASKALFGDNRLVNDPDMVARDENVAWKVSFWFWRYRVRTDNRVLQGQFGAATDRINGGQECHPCRKACNNRFNIYGKVLKAFGISERPNPQGC
ncbi:chitinase [Acrasis kona]|uniref:Chitinase n=1 Tax=Acrasis kona TaxID=1008807 RepID=A0AAW2Z8F5_9EUKA